MAVALIPWRAAQMRDAHSQPNNAPIIEALPASFVEDDAIRQPYQLDISGSSVGKLSLILR